MLHLERWDPKVGCSQSCEQLKDVWVRVMGLPLHLWSRKVLKKIGDYCGGFVTMDESTNAFKELQWARVLVKLEGLEWPSSLQVVIDTTCFAIQLWWEVLPRVSEVFPVSRNGSGKEEVREKDERASLVNCVVEQMQSTGQPAKVVVPSKDGEKRCRTDMETFFSDLMPTRRAQADASKRRQKYGGKNNSNFWPVAKVNGTLGWVLKTVVERRPDEKGLLGNKEEHGLAHLGLNSNRLEAKVQKRPNEEGLLVFTEDYGLSHLGPLPNMHINCMEVGRPTLDSSKGPIEVGRPTVED